MYITCLYDHRSFHSLTDAAVNFAKDKKTREQTAFLLIVFDHGYKVGYSNERGKSQEHKCFALPWIVAKSTEQMNPVGIP